MSDAIRQFIHGYIESVEQLEVLLLLHREEGRPLDVARVSAELRSDPASIQGRLELLKKQGFVSPSEKQPGSYEFRPARPELREQVAIVAQAYKERRFSIINMIFSKPQDAIRAFAEAFRLRKD